MNVIGKVSLAVVCGLAAYFAQAQSESKPYTGNHPWIVYKIRESDDGKIIRVDIGGAKTKSEAEELRDAAQRAGSQSITDPWDYYTERRPKGYKSPEASEVEHVTPTPAKKLPAVRAQGKPAKSQFVGRFSVEEGYDGYTRINLQSDGTGVVARAGQGESRRSFKVRWTEEDGGLKMSVVEVLSHDTYATDCVESDLKGFFKSNWKFDGGVLKPYYNGKFYDDRLSRLTRQ